MQVVTVANRVPTEPYYRFHEFVESLAKFDVKPVVLGMNEWWKGLMTKPFRYREYLRANPTGRVILCDAFDVVFAQHPESVDEWCRHVFGDDMVVFNGEKGCWPREDLKEYFPDMGSPWRYLNSGFLIGRADRVLAILEAMDIETIGFDPPGGPYPNDQGEFQRLYAERPDLGMVVDTDCVLAQTLSACALDEFDFTGSMIRNRMTGEAPGAFHCNGGSKEIFQDALFAKLGLGHTRPTA